MEFVPGVVSDPKFSQPVARTASPKLTGKLPLILGGLTPSDTLPGTHPAAPTASGLVPRA